MWLLSGVLGVVALTITEVAISFYSFFSMSKMYCSPTSGQNRKKRVYSSKYALSCIVYCSKCGDIYRRVVWNNHGKQSVVWRCCTRVEHGPGACNADAIHESELQNLVVRAINMALGKKDTMNEKNARHRPILSNKHSH